ncbi:DotD/TraH family lipoprotein [Bosea sp. RAC05]|uniref:DotD/TraH family lipoprotein n=1 Tax=Bosea sp. RAC05 TaxID=1842539 RepID=UPI00083D1095|nr:DotD/TraH family lipoprotein [Bosea sp. RAC05]AOG03483.1 putative lipoprotein [Bosea sp. RAC05]
MTLTRRALVCAAFATSLTVMGGCASKVAVEAPVVEGPDASKLLAESADRAARAQEELARIQTARTAPVPRPVEENLAGVPDDLRRTATMEWSGPAEEAARRMAAIVGWDFRVIGNAPATPVMVSVSMRDIAAVKIMENIGLQAQPFAQVAAIASQRRIEFRHLAGGRAVRATSDRMTK